MSKNKSWEFNTAKQNMKVLQYGESENWALHIKVYGHHFVP